MIFETMSLGEKLAGGLGLTFLGMGVVFLVLLVVSFSLDGLRLFCSRLPERQFLKEKPVPRETAEEDDSELVAVIAAAVAAYTESPMEGLRVRSIRKLPGNRCLWGSAGRQAQMQERL